MTENEVNEVKIEVKQEPIMTIKEKKMRRGEIRCITCSKIFGVTIRRRKALIKKAKSEKKLIETYQCRSCRPHLTEDEKKVRAAISAKRSMAKKKALARKALKQASKVKEVVPAEPTNECMALMVIN